MKAELIDYMGSDLTVVNAARVSFDKEANWAKDFDTEYIYGELNPGDERLINYLANHGHWTPFSHCTITLRETIPIFVARQRFKHMVGFTYNEVSRRYVSDSPEFFFPDVWRKGAENKKQGSSDESIERVDWRALDYDGSSLGYTSSHGGVLLDYVHNVALMAYKSLLEAGTAPEQARMVLPQSMYTSYYVTGSLYAFARAYNLRTTPDAQKEIRDLAEMWDKVIRPLYPVSWSALCGG
jgi:thymidylate synthase (FAD)